MKKDTNILASSVDTQKHQQRPSLISILTGQNQPTASQHSSTILHDFKTNTGLYTPSDTFSQNTLNPPKESLSGSFTTTNKDQGISSENASSGTTPSASNNTCIIPVTTGQIGGSVPHLPHSSSTQSASKVHSQRLRFVQSVEFRHSSGERSTTPLSPESPTEESSGESQKPHRLQRSKAQSRKTFRLKRAQNNSRDGLGFNINRETKSAAPSPPTLSQASSTTTLTAIPLTSTAMTMPVAGSSYISAPIKPVSDVSWDSVSQTSSTSGYRDNYSFQTGFLSPDDKSGSQQSLLMLFETQDEDTLI